MRYLLILILALIAVQSSSKLDLEKIQKVTNYDEKCIKLLEKYMLFENKAIVCGNYTTKENKETEYGCLVESKIDGIIYYSPIETWYNNIRSKYIKINGKNYENDIFLYCEGLKQKEFDFTLVKATKYNYLVHIDYLSLLIKELYDLKKENDKKESPISKKLKESPQSRDARDGVYSVNLNKK